MNYQVNLKLQAHQDILETVLWYETQRTGLGAEFYEEVEKVKEILSSNPLMFEIKYKDKVRWVQTERFPYIVVYVVNQSDVVILTVASTHRNPTIWKSRL